MNENGPAATTRALRLRTWMLAIAGFAVVLAITPRWYLPIVAIFAVVATAAAAVLRLSTGARWLTAFAWVMALYPLLIVGLVYACWFATWYELGRVPRPSLDDPENIGGSVAPAYFAAMASALTWAPALLTAVPLSLVRSSIWLTKRPRLHRAAMLLMLAGITSWVLLFVLASIDPGGVFDWFGD